MIIVTTQMNTAPNKNWRPRTLTHSFRFPRLGYVSLALLALGLSPCRANLGDTSAQIKARYGDVIEKFGDTGPKKFRFHRPGVETDTVDVSFQSGKSQEEIYLHWKSKALEEVDETGSFSQKDTDAFLKANSQGLTWRKQPSQLDGLTIWLLGSNDPATALSKAIRDDEGHSFRVVSLMFDSSLTLDAATGAQLDALFPETQPRKPVADHSPSPLKSDLLPVLKILGQPPSIVNKMLGNPSQHWLIHEPNKRVGGKTNKYPVGRDLFVDFYQDKAAFISFAFWEPFPTSEAELFDVLGLPKSGFQKTFENQANTGFRGVAGNRVIEILAMHQGGGTGFCSAVNIELIHTLN
jgi:hypothetical protein